MAMRSRENVMVLWFFRDIFRDSEFTVPRENDLDSTGS